MFSQRLIKFKIMKLNYLFNDFVDCERAAETSLLRMKRRRQHQFVQPEFKNTKKDR